MFPIWKPGNQEAIVLEVLGYLHSWRVLACFVLGVVLAANSFTSEAAIIVGAVLGLAVGLLWETTRTK